jgi:2-hydroxy-3-keto-5-methylthiopentenyl-1-phosphate phosphatase
MIQMVRKHRVDPTVDRETDYLTDNLGFGVEKRLGLNTAVLDHSRSFRSISHLYKGADIRDIFSEMLDSVHTPFPECIETLTERSAHSPLCFLC